MAFKSLTNQTYKNIYRNNLYINRVNKKFNHIPLSKKSIEKDIKDHAIGGARYCCLNANIIFQPECNNHRWHLWTNKQKPY